jgi:hypothetical protein
MGHQNHDSDNNDQSYEKVDQWELACFQCHKPISADRPPNYNCENCSSVEVGTHANGAGQHFSYPMVREQPMYHYAVTTPTQYHNQSPQSYASSNLSGPCPEGPEKEDPNMHFTTTYLPLGPPIGLNEIQHQRTASFHSDMSLPMQRFLSSCDYHEPYATVHVPMESRFLQQDLYIVSQASKKVHQSTKRSKQSYMSMQSSGSHETGTDSWGLMDPVAEVGSWDRESGDLLPGDYALALSGLTEFHINDDMK